MLDDLINLFGRKQTPVLALMPGLAAPSTARSLPTRPGGTDGGSCDGGSDEFRELRFNRRSSPPSRASSR